MHSARVRSVGRTDRRPSSGSVPQDFFDELRSPLPCNKTMLPLPLRLAELSTCLLSQPKTFHDSSRQDDPQTSTHHLFVVGVRVSHAGVKGERRSRDTTPLPASDGFPGDPESTSLWYRGPTGSTGRGSLPRVRLPPRRVPNGRRPSPLRQGPTTGDTTHVLSFCVSLVSGAMLVCVSVSRTVSGRVGVPGGSESKFLFHTLYPVG